MNTENQTDRKSPKWVKPAILIGAVALGSLFLLRSGVNLLTEKGIEKTLEQKMGGNAKVDITGGGIVVRDEQNGQYLAIQATQQLPQGMPSDVPVFSPARVTGSMIMGPMTMVTLESGSSVKDVIGFYQGQLASKGWNQIFAGSPDAQNYSAVYKKKDRQLTVTSSRSNEGDKTSIALSFGTDPSQN